MSRRFEIAHKKGGMTVGERAGEDSWIVSFHVKAKVQHLVMNNI